MYILFPVVSPNSGLPNKVDDQNSQQKLRIYPGHPLVEVAGDLLLRPMRLPAFHRQQEDWSIISMHDILLLHFQDAILPVRTHLPFDVPELQEFVLHLLTSPSQKSEKS